MPLQKQIVPISFAQGLDTKTDDYQVVPTKLLTLENGILTTTRSVRKRFGYQLLGLNLVQGVGLSPFQSELTMEDGTSLMSYSMGVNNWTNKGPVMNIDLNSYPVIRNTYQQTTPDSAYHSNGLEVYTWEDSRGTARYSVVDSATRQAILQDIDIGAGSTIPKPFALGQNLIIIFRQTDDLKYLAIPAANPTNVQGPFTLANSFNPTDANYDAVLVPSQDKVYVAFNDSVAGGGISVVFLDHLLNLSTKRTVTGENASVCITTFFDDVLDQIWVAYFNGTDEKYFVRAGTNTMTLVLGPTFLDDEASVRNITGLATNGNAVIYYEVGGGATYNNNIVSNTASNVGVIGSASIFVRSVGLSAKAFYQDNVRYIPTAYSSNLQPTYFLLNQDNIVVGKWSPTSGGGLTVKSILPNSTFIGSTTILIAGLIKDLFTTVSGAIYTQTGVASYFFNFDNQDAPQKVELSHNLHLSGGLLVMYDGFSTVEHSFNLFPENITGVVASGGSLSTGQYQYQVCYEWTDNQGQIHRSAPSIASTFTASSSDKITLTIPTLRLTQKKAPTRTPVDIVIYRTEANGLVFYRITSITAPLFNDTTVDTVTYEDTAADSTIIGNPVLYTTGGVVENIALPAPALLTQYKDRAIGVPAENRLQWWYSKEVSEGQPVEFSDLFTNQVDHRGGDIISVQQMDDKIIFLKKYNVMYVVGNGPTANGSQNDFTEAQIVSADGGCSDKNSVVLTPAGLMYKSLKGIYILDRSLGVTYIGDEVEAYNSSRVLAASLVPDTTQARFCLDSGITLMYDYYFRQWSVFTNLDGVDNAIFNKQYVYLTPTGDVLEETPNLYTDNGSFIRLKLITAWLSLAQLQGYQRVYGLNLLGHYKSEHKLRVRVGFDFNDAYIQEDYIPATTIFDLSAYGDLSPYGSDSPYGGNFPLYMWEINMIQQKCTSLRVAIEDTQERPFGGGMSLSGITCEVGTKGGLNRVAPNKSFGGQG